MSKTCKHCNYSVPEEQFKTSRMCILCFKRKKKERNQKYNATNPEKVGEWSKNYSLNNPEKRKGSRLKWKRNNIGKVKADKAGRKERIVIATPKWLDDMQKEMIAHIYEMAELRSIMFNIPYHVDHIIPLKGENVCGLHVPWNLEEIPADENLKKNNKLLPWRAFSGY